MAEPITPKGEILLGERWAKTLEDAQTLMVQLAAEHAWVRVHDEKGQAVWVRPEQVRAVR
jgi:hypothetical protein